MDANPAGLPLISVEGLMNYAEAMARRSPPDGVTFPEPPPPTADRARRAAEAIPRLQAFVDRAVQGFDNAASYRAARRKLIDDGCGGDPLVFYVAWNRLLAEGRLAPLLHGPIRSIQKPLGRRPVAIVPRAQLTPQLSEGRIVLDLGDDRFWLLPRDLTGRALLFTMRHGVSRVESKTHRVGQRLANTLEPGRGLPKADAVGAALARMVGAVGQQLDFLHLENYLDPKTFRHQISSSPNTRQLFERVTAAMTRNDGGLPEATVDPALESQDFGWVTGLEKTAEVEEAARAFGVDAKTAKRLIKHPLYCYPGGNSFFDLYADVVDGFHRIAQAHQGGVVSLYTHSSTLRALITYLDPRPFHEAFSEFGEYKEGQDNVVLLAYENGRLSGYSTAVGLSERERTAREAWVTVERERIGRVTLKPRQIRQIVALVSGGDFAGAGAALKELRAAGDRQGITVHFVRHGFLGLANNWIERFTDREMRGMAGFSSSPIGSSRFEDFKEEEVQALALRNLSPYLENGALVVIGGDGSLRGARALFEKFGVQVVGLPGTIDDNLAGTTSLGYHSAVALADHSLQSLKATSAAMGSIFFVEVMGAGAGHLALSCAHQARAEGILVNEHPDPDAYIDQVILGTLKRSMGVPNKSHLFVVAEKTPHRHHPLGGVHGLVDYIAQSIAQWPPVQRGQDRYQLTVATKATILGHTLRGAPPVPQDKALAQHFAYETVQRLIESPERAVGCLLAARGEGAIEAIPLHSIAAKPFDWELFSRMHGNISSTSF
ncbi:MAG: 6-phosphofructokinase [Nitrospirae bacterium]|nr:6-phosphofructokinase [Candidatus Manganitrophaceae bacterium]